MSSIMREDWIEVELGEVCNIYPGIGFPKSKQGKSDGEFPFYKVGDISKNFKSGYRKLTICDNYIDSGDIGNIKANLIPTNSVVFAKIGEALKLNRRCLTAVECLIDNNAIGLKAVDKLNDLYLFFFFLTIRLEDYSRATTVPSVRKTDIEEIAFPLAPLPIQRAIVSKIEALFSDLDNGIANFKKAQEQLKIYRQAVLKKAFEGYSILTTVGDEFDFVGGGTPSKANSDYWNGDLFWCSVKDVKGDYLHKTIDKITTKGLEESASNLAQPEEVILITRISPGKTIISKVETAINQDLKVVKPKRDYLPKLIHYLFQDYEREIVKLSSGTTVLGINLTNLKSIEIPLLNTQEQTQIVQEIESRLSVCDKMEQSISESLEKAEALRQSILKKAFEGKLLSEAEIEQCKQTADYEPASELLKKIQAEKLAKEQEKKKKPTDKKKSKK